MLEVRSSPVKLASTVLPLLVLLETETEILLERDASATQQSWCRPAAPTARLAQQMHHGGWRAGLPVDYEEAAQEYLKASEAKHSEAPCGMGYMHQTGKGVPQDLFLAKRYFDDAALHNDDAVPVVRLPLFLLRLQWAWTSWGEWWPGLQLSEFKWSGNHAAGDGGQEAFSATETFSLLGLALLLLIIMGERGRRQRARRRREIGNEEG